MKSLDNLIASIDLLPPEERGRLAWEVRIQLLVDEAIATSAIEGIKLDPKEVRRAVLTVLAKQEGLL